MPAEARLAASLSCCIREDGRVEHLSSMAALPYSRALTVEDLLELPDDGHRYELIHGSLLVTPVPNVHHQVVVGRLYRAFDDVVPEGLLAVVAPCEWRLEPDTALQPDVLVVRRDDAAAFHSVPPLLVAEVLSPSTRSFDLLVKRDEYERGGVEAYWVVDPDVPSVTVMARQSDRLVVVASAEGDTELAVEQPFPVRVRPSDLTL